MKRCFISILLLFCATHYALAAEQTATVLAASSTSSQPGSASITCLLDQHCTGEWSPGALDSGTDEGIYIQFEKPLAAKHIKLTLKSFITKTEQPIRQTGSWNAPDPLTIYINGKTGGSAGQYVLAPWDTNCAGNVCRETVYVTFGWDPPLPLPEKIKSVFIKIDNSRIGGSTRTSISRIQFLLSDFSEKGPDRIIPLTLPKLIPATISASSTLSPQTAYQPANLVDSKYDMAWSADGKKTDGRGQSFTVGFNSPQTISGILLWNGYQRSEKHFKANGRVIEANISTDTDQKEHLSIEDTMDPQKIFFSLPLNDIRNLTFTISDVKLGTKYKDVLISEILFIDTVGRMILPSVTPQKVDAPQGVQPLLDRSFAAILHHPMDAHESDPNKEGFCHLSHECDNSRIRLRSNGTYVIYKDYDYAPGDVDNKETNASVLEGNWETIGKNIRIFGRQYKTAIRTDEYLKGEVKKPRTTIFQSEMTIKPYNALTQAEKKKLFGFLWAKKKGTANRNQQLYWVIGNDVGCAKKLQSGPANTFTSDVGCLVEGSNYENLLQNMGKELSRLNPYWISSSVLSDLFLPTDSVLECLSDMD